MIMADLNAQIVKDALLTLPCACHQDNLTKGRVCCLHGALDALESIMQDYHDVLTIANRNGAIVNQFMESKTKQINKEHSLIRGLLAIVAQGPDDEDGRSQIVLEARAYMKDKP